MDFVYMRCSFVVWIFLLLTVCATPGYSIDADYYFGTDNSLLRSVKLNCNNKLSQLYCRNRCGELPGACVLNKCFCIKQLEIEDEADDDDDDTHMREIQPIKSLSSYLGSYLNPRRHHIAHFCPTLDKARECIKKCMKKGKLAFCGKDHVCYCGHKVDKELRYDPKDLYAEFRDLYERYFGPEKDPTTTTTEAPKQEEVKVEEPDESDGDNSGTDSQETEPSTDEDEDNEDVTITDGSTTTDTTTAETPTTSKD